MPLSDFDHLAYDVFPATMRAGREIMAVFKSGPTAVAKADGSPVTVADRISEDIIIEALASIAPGVPVIAEEQASLGQLAAIGDTFFLVDPLDGTKEFAARRPEFTVNIALINARRPVFGLIYAPALGQLYWTKSQTEAYSATVTPDSSSVALAQVGARPLNTREARQKDLTIVASRSHGSDDLEIWLKDIDVAGRTNIGSSLKFCLIAEGSADLYPRFGPTKEWDTAAGHAIALAAGGAVTRIDGSPLFYGKTAENYLNPGFIVWSRPGMIDHYRTGALVRSA